MKPSNTDFLLILGSALSEWFAIRWPLLLVFLLGIIVAVHRRKHHPRVSKVCVLGLGVLLVNHVLWMVLQASVYELRKAALIWTVDDSFWPNMLAFLECVVEAGAMGLVVVAVFMGRSSAATGAPPPKPAACSEQADTSIREGRPT
jgi:hypothetical protein